MATSESCCHHYSKESKGRGSVLAIWSQGPQKKLDTQWGTQWELGPQMERASHRRWNHGDIATAKNGDLKQRKQ